MHFFPTAVTTRDYPDTCQKILQIVIYITVNKIVIIKLTITYTIIIR